jgi:hypothetical protein
MRSLADATKQQQCYTAAGPAPCYPWTPPKPVVAQPAPEPARAPSVWSCGGPGWEDVCMDQYGNGRATHPIWVRNFDGPPWVPYINVGGND